MKDRRITPVLDRALSRRYRYPRAAYRTVRLPARPAPRARDPTPTGDRQRDPGRMPGDHPPARPRPDRARAPATPGTDILARHRLCFVTVVERHGISGAVGARLPEGLRPEGRGGRQLGRPRCAQHHPGGEERARHAEGARRDQAHARRGLRRPQGQGRRQGGPPGRGPHVGQEGPGRRHGRRRGSSAPGGPRAAGSPTWASTSSRCRSSRRSG